MKKTTLGLVVTLAFLLAACGSSPQTIVVTPTPDTLATQAADNQGLLSTIAANQAVFAAQTQTAEVSPTDSPTASPTDKATQAAATQIAATSSPTPTSITLPTLTAAPIACNAAQFVSDLSIQDGSLFQAKESFVKTWRIKNIGSCIWEDGYAIRFSDGTNLATKNEYDLPAVVRPGDSIDISINMAAPNSVGTFESNWMLVSKDGKRFGVGLASSNPIYLSIQVIAKANPDFAYDFAANACAATWSSSSGTLPCPGSESNQNSGFVIVLNKAELENKTTNKLTLWTHPSHFENGYIRGLYPTITIGKDKHFTAEVGCLEGNKGCSVRFRLDYINSNGKVINLGSWAEVLDGGIREIDIDLSHLEGKKVQFILTMQPRTTNYSAADGFWHQPAIK